MHLIKEKEKALVKASSSPRARTRPNPKRVNESCCRDVHAFSLSLYRAPLPGVYVCVGTAALDESALRALSSSLSLSLSLSLSPSGARLRRAATLSVSGGIRRQSRISRARSLALVTGCRRRCCCPQPHSVYLYICVRALSLYLSYYTSKDACALSRNGLENAAAACRSSSCYYCTFGRSPREMRVDRVDIHIRTYLLLKLRLHCRWWVVIRRVCIYRRGEVERLGLRVPFMMMMMMGGAGDKLLNKRAILFVRFKNSASGYI